MNYVLGGASAIAIGAGAYLLLAGPASDDAVVAALQATMDDTAEITLQTCDLQVSIDTPTPIGVTQSRMRIDLNVYNLEEVRITPFRDNFYYQAGRGRATNAMMAQASAVFDLIEGAQDGLIPQGDDLRDVLDDPSTALFSNLMAQIETDENGDQVLVAHETAPQVYDFVQAVTQLDGPASYKVVANYQGGDVARDTLVTAEVVAVPMLEIRFDTQEAAQSFGQRIYDHTAFACP